MHKTIFSECCQWLQVLPVVLCYHQEGHTDGGGVKGKVRKGNRRGKGEEKHHVNNHPSLDLLQMNMASLCSPHNILHDTVGPVLIVRI